MEISVSFNFFIIRISIIVQGNSRIMVPFQKIRMLRLLQ